VKPNSGFGIFLDIYHKLFRQAIRHRIQFAMISVGAASTSDTAITAVWCTVTHNIAILFNHLQNPAYNNKNLLKLTQKSSYLSYFQKNYYKL